MKLTPRLKTIADLVPQGSIVADIGTDHGYIPVYLIKEKISKKVIAADINEGPLDNARKTIEHHNYSHLIETRLGNGLEVIHPKEIDTLIIAGMGGMLIKDILEANLEIVNSIEYIILQPMNAQDIVRKWLEINKFRIVKEKLAKEGNKLYEIILVVKGKMKFEDEIYYEIGYNLINREEPLFKEFILNKLKKYRKIYNMVKNGDSPKANMIKVEIEDKIKKLLEVLRCL